jgi:hypothetical protein
MRQSLEHGGGVDVNDSGAGGHEDVDDGRHALVGDLAGDSPLQALPCRVCVMLLEHRAHLDAQHQEPATMHGFHGGQVVILLLCHKCLGDQHHGHHHRVVGHHAAVDEVILTLRPASVPGLEAMRGQVGRRGGRADAHIQEQSVLLRHALGLHIYIYLFIETINSREII